MASSGSVVLVVIVERSHDMDTIDALETVGIATMTVLAGTGTGVWQTLERQVDAEKMVMLAVIDAQLLNAAYAALRQHAGFDIPGRGIAFSIPVGSGIGAGLPGFG